MYELSREKLETLSDYQNVDSFIRPNHYEIPIYAKGRWVYTISVSLRGQGWICTSSETGGSNVWDTIRSVWPEEKGDYFIAIIWGGARMLHFPLKNSYNLTVIPGYPTGTEFDTKDIRVLGDSRKILPLLKQGLEEGKNNNFQHPEPMEMQNAAVNMTSNNKQKCDFFGYDLVLYDKCVSPYYFKILKINQLLVDITVRLNIS